ncbi:alpha/beta hydrolase [soil metagenome]
MTTDEDTSPNAGDDPDPDPGDDEHPAMASVRKLLAAAEPDKGTLPERRAAMDGVTVDVPTPPGTTTELVSLGGRPGEWSVPDGADRDRAVLYLHGGGYCMGSLTSQRDLVGRLALASGIAFISLDYRLAPEHPHPAALDDAVAAYRDLRASGFGAHQLALAGDSAGAGLVFATTLALRSAGEDVPAALAALSPWVDLTPSSAGLEPARDGDPTTGSGLEEMAEAYLAGIDPRTPLVSPVRAPRADLIGFPPVRIDAGADEVLVDDATVLTTNLRDAGVDVTITVWPDMVHVFQVFPAEVVPESAESITEIGRFLGSHLGASTSGS